ncbi:MAG: hypothetical protein GF390_00170 [Candidatus Pacebacteria bacterium]|nr:hypothetical protein [Candidatus Paceibacterota bacterium]
MNFSIELPFSQLQFQNAQLRHQDFFNKLFFQTNSTTQPLIIITINFKKLSAVNFQTQLEGQAFSDGSSFFIQDTQKNLVKLNLHDFTSKKLNLVVEPDFDLYYLFTFVIEPLLIIWSASYQILYLHASGIVDQHNQATVLTAWRHTGKTDQVLQLMQKDCDFIGDDYCVVKDQQVYLYPKVINLFSYNLARFPQLYQNLPILTSWRLKLTMQLKKFLAKLSLLFRGPVGKVFYRLAELAEVSTNIGVSPSQLNIDSKSQAQLKQLTILQKTSKSKPLTDQEKTLTKKQTVNKLNTIINYELKNFYQLYQQYCFLFPTKKIIAIEQFSTNYDKVVRGVLRNLAVKLRLV